MTEKEEAGHSILVAEDDEGLAYLIKKNLGQEGFRVECASRGSEAIRKIRQNPKTLMLLDYRLADMTGKQVVETLIDQGMKVPFVIITGHGDERTAVDMMKLGARDYLMKDTAFLELLPSIVKQVIEQLKIEEQLAKAEAQREELILELQDALAKVKTLSGMLPICSSCKKIRDDKGYWNQIEKYLTDHSEAELTHSLCPACVKSLYPELKLK